MEQPVQDYVEQFHFGLVEVKDTKGRKAKVFNVYSLVPKKVESWADFWNQNKWTIILTAFITAFIQDKDRRIGRRIFPGKFSGRLQVGPRHLVLRDCSNDRGTRTHFLSKMFFWCNDLNQLI